MSFNSLIFAAFLQIVFCLYWFVFGRNLKWQNAFVVVASYVFYGWWDWKFLILIAVTSFCSWGSGLLIYKFKDNRRKARWISATNLLPQFCRERKFEYSEAHQWPTVKSILDGTWVV